MKKTFLFILTALCLMTCKKEIVDVDTTDPSNGITSCDYAPYTTGSTFTYEQETPLGVYTATWEVGQDTLINGKSFIELLGFLGAIDTAYFSCEGGDYTIFTNQFPASTSDLEIIYLKEGIAEGGTWTKTLDQESGGLSFQTRYHSYPPRYLFNYCRSFNISI